MAEKAAEEMQEAKQLDLTAAGRGVWLVKVPKYLSERWKNSDSEDVGKIIIKKSKLDSQKPEITFTSNEAIVNQKGSTFSTPRLHKFTVTGMTSQDMVVFSQDTTSGQMAVEGKVTQRAECQPLSGDDTYMQMKRMQLAASNKAKRETVMLDRALPLYKSSKDDQHRVKAADKRYRMDKDKVMDMLFAAFEKHQYYSIKNLVNITQQPPVYIREILQEICLYNTVPPHKFMWELKPEFRHYKKVDSN